MPLLADRKPNTVGYLESRGLKLSGPGKWKTTLCESHGGSDSMRVNTETGGWCCMACGAKGGDALSYVMQVDGLSFIDAAKALGCWQDAPDGHVPRNPRPAGLSAGDALHLLREESRLLGVAWAMQRAGHQLSEAESQRALEAVGRINLISGGLDGAH
jgi:hypothetical protein